MDVIIWAIILGAIFYINKKSKSAGSKNTQPNKTRPQQKQIQQIWNSMQNTVQLGMNALNQTYQQKPQQQMQQSSTRAASETTDAAESTATAETAAEQSGYSAEGREK